MNDLMNKIVSLARRRGFIFPGSEIYGGLAGTWDWGPLGVFLKNNIKREWSRMFIDERHDIYWVDASIVMNAKVWEASGHVAGFSDPLVECRKCHERFRSDKIDIEAGCPSCGGRDFTDPRPFNMMFKTYVGPAEDSAALAYLRPETAQGMFVNFKNVMDSMHPKLPFGIAQIGRAFRNEITPANFIFRIREFEQMEIEYFVEAEDWERQFGLWLSEMRRWLDFLGIRGKTRELEIPAGERAHYSRRTVDIDFDFPFGRGELYGIAYRGDFDLSNHRMLSGADLSYFNDEKKERIVPHVIEPTFGVERTVLALFAAHYMEEDGRFVLQLPRRLSPITVAVFPLLANKPQLVDRARELFNNLKSDFRAVWDERGNIGKRYYSQDEIGTPWCVTADFQTLEDDTVTVRDRDTAAQERVYAKELRSYFADKLKIL